MKQHLPKGHRSINNKTRAFGLIRCTWVILGGLTSAQASLTQIQSSLYHLTCQYKIPKESDVTLQAHLILNS